MSFRERVEPDLQPIFALLLTLFLLVPVCAKMFVDGLSSDYQSPRYRVRSIVIGNSLAAIAFFLASFQVHEKSILIVLAPFSLLQFHKFNSDGDGDDNIKCTGNKTYSNVEWFSLLSAWTLLPLMKVDKLVIPMLVCIVLHVLTGRILKSEGIGAVGDNKGGLISLMRFVGYCLMVGITLLEIFYAPPTSLPDVYPLLYALVGCGCFGVFYLVTLIEFATEVAPVSKPGCDDDVDGIKTRSMRKKQKAF